MNDERSDDRNENGAPTGARYNAGATSPGEPVVTDTPSSKQSRSAPPAGTEPQGNTTIIAAVIAIVIIAVVTIIVLL